MGGFDLDAFAWNAFDVGMSMATALSSIIADARTVLNEPTANFWTDAELLKHASSGCRDLWRAIIDLHQGHFQVVDESSVSLTANTGTLTGVPTNTFRVELIEVRDQTSANATQNCTFTPRKSNHPLFSGARSLGAVDPSGRELYFDIINAGSPVTTPSILVAPQITATVPLRFIYTATLGALTDPTTANPIPGESDHALMCWIIAHAKAKERPKNDPDPEWISFYATDKALLLTALTPRQDQEPDVSEGVFEAYW